MAQTDATRQLRAIYGDKARETLDLAERFVNRDPRVKSFLDTTGLGHSPRVVMRLAELALEARSRGQIK